MRMFKQIQKSYKTQNNAIAAAQKSHPDAMNEFRWIVGVTPENRFHIIFVGQQSLHMAHDGFCVTC